MESYVFTSFYIVRIKHPLVINRSTGLAINISCSNMSVLIGTSIRIYGRSCDTEDFVSICPIRQIIKNSNFVVHQDK